MKARLRLDLGWGDLLWALGAVALAHGPARRMQRIEARWPATRALCTLSARSALDLALAAQAWPAGSEVVTSAITIPDTARILAAHGLVCVPVDVSPGSLAPTRAALEAARTERTRAVLVAHLFGATIDLAPAASFAEEHGLFLIEDAAQAFGQIETEPGRPGCARSDLVLYSFGTIKTATALGGSVAFVRSPSLHAEMLRLRDLQPSASRLGRLRRVLVAAGLHALSAPVPYGWLHRIGHTLGVDIETRLRGSVRGFAGEDLLRAIRRCPSAALLALLERRLRQNHGARLARRAAAAAALARELDGSVEVPGEAVVLHTYWVFPVLSRAPGGTVAALRAAGIDASSRSSLVALGEVGSCPEAHDLLARIVYLPTVESLDANERREIAALLSTGTMT